VRPCAHPALHVRSTHGRTSVLSCVKSRDGTDEPPGSKTRSSRVPSRDRTPALFSSIRFNHSQSLSAPLISSHSLTSSLLIGHAGRQADNQQKTSQKTVRKQAHQVLSTDFLFPTSLPVSTRVPHAGMQCRPSNAAFLDVNSKMVTMARSGGRLVGHHETRRTEPSMRPEKAECASSQPARLPCQANPIQFNPIHPSVRPSVSQSVDRPPTSHRDSHETVCTHETGQDEDAPPRHDTTRHDTTRPTRTIHSSIHPRTNARTLLGRQGMSAWGGQTSPR